MSESRGFALPVTLFVVAILTLMLSVLFIRVQTDRRIADSSGDLVGALTVAQSGLQTYLGSVSFDGCDRAVRPLDGDSVRINVQGGYADVVAHVVQRPADTLTPWMYIVRSTGHLIRPTQGQDPQAVRTVAQFAHWQRNALNVIAAFTSANKMHGCMGSTTGQLKGDDQAQSGCTDPSVLGFRTPSSGAPSLPGYVTNGVSPYVLESGSTKTIADSSLIDWSEVLSGGIVPDYTSVRFWDASYPVMLVQGDLTITCGPGTTTGYGLLIVSNNLKITGTGSPCLQWFGVVLVGGTITFDAEDQRFDGVVMSGLQGQSGSVGDSHAHGNYVDIDYDSGFIRLALKSLAGFAPVGNAWVDNWATY